MDNGGAYIKSKANDSEQPVYIGFSGIPLEGVKLIAGPRENARIWDIQPDVPPSNKYCHYILSLFLSLISFDRIRLQGTPFMMEFPRNNLDPGTHAQLGLPILDGSDNQTWIVIIRESYSHELPRLYTLLTPSVE